MDAIQRQSIDQNFRKFTETSGFSDFYDQKYTGFSRDIRN